MLGQIKWGSVRKPKLEQGDICGLRVLTLVLPERIRSKDHAINRGLRLLTERRVTRVLVPKDWHSWALLGQNGLRTVDTGEFRCALTPAWVKVLLREKGIMPHTAVLLLQGERESVEMERVARLLCPMVRGVAIDVPGDSAIAGMLRKEFGLSVFPVHSEQMDLTVNFSPVPALFGVEFETTGDLKLPMDYDPVPILSVLWENHRIKMEDILLKRAVNVDFP